MSNKNKINKISNKSIFKKKQKVRQSLKDLRLIDTNKYLLATFLFIFTTIIFFVVFKKIKFQADSKLAKDNVIIVTHGTFGTLLGLRNLFQIMKDDISGTVYKKNVNRMRTDSNFYSSQPIMQEGLIKIKPSYDLAVTFSKKFVTYPILKAYEELNHQIYPTENKNHYYTFGWSGLVTQTNRRKEAIRFYNLLCEEIEKYLNRPKLKIVAHSHGGNLALNLAAVNKVINNLDNLEQLLESAKTEDEKETLFSMYKDILSLPSKSAAQKNIGQTKFDYMPEKKDLRVDELVMFGCPVQVETEALVLNNFFKRIYHIYSDNDMVQSIDYFSTKKYSKRRINIKNITKKIESSKIGNTPKLIQLRIMIDKEMKKTMINGNKIMTLSPSRPKTSKNFFQKLFSTGKENGPRHKEMFFISWENIKDSINNPLKLIPLVIFTPLFLNAIETIPNHSNDIDINIKLTEKKLKVYVFNHKANNKVLQNKTSIPREMVDSIKNKLMQWIPDDISPENQFNRIKDYQIKY